MTQWEEDHCRPFIVHDVRYLDRVDNEVQQHMTAKEEEKNKRVSLSSQTVVGMVYLMLAYVQCSNNSRLKQQC